MVLPAPKWWKLILVPWGSDQFGLTFCWSNSQISSYPWRLQFVFIRIFRTACQAILAIHNGHLRRWPSTLQPGLHRLPQQIPKINLIAGYCKILKEPMWFEKLHDEVGYNWLWWILPVRFWKVAMTVKACCWMLSTCSCELQSKIGHDLSMKQDQDKTHLRSFKWFPMIPWTAVIILKMYRFARLEVGWKLCTLGTLQLEHLRVASSWTLQVPTWFLPSCGFVFGNPKQHNKDSERFANTMNVWCWH